MAAPTDEIQARIGSYFGFTGRTVCCGRPGGSAMGSSVKRNLVASEARSAAEAEGSRANANRTATRTRTKMAGSDRRKKPTDCGGKWSPLS
jgi:hypothetical protein